MPPPSPQDLLREGRVEECLKAVEDAVRKNPADSKQRVVLFQVLCILGQWDRALNQLVVCASLDSMASLMAQMYRQAILCERIREDVYKGSRTPLILGEPQPWMGMVVQAAVLAARGQHAAAAQLRDQAFELAPTVAGEIDVGPAHKNDRQAEKAGKVVTTHTFEWFGDADPRLGPMFEAIVAGKYYWIPFERVSLLRIEPPEDLRDSVWMPCQIVWTAGAEQVALIPTRYPGSQASPDGLIKLARKTEFQTHGSGEDAIDLPIGQRLFATDAGEFPIMDVRAVRLGSQENVPSGDEQAESEESAQV